MSDNEHRNKDNSIKSNDTNSSQNVFAMEY